MMNDYTQGVARTVHGFKVLACRTVGCTGLFKQGVCILCIIMPAVIYLEASFVKRDLQLAHEGPPSLMT